jgi:hypothetical protein
MCWVACDRGARLARLHDEPDYAERWQKAADEIHADILAHGPDERGVFVQHYDTTALDASVLLMPLVRFLTRARAGTGATSLSRSPTSPHQRGHARHPGRGSHRDGAIRHAPTAQALTSPTPQTA